MQSMFEHKTIIDCSVDSCRFNEQCKECTLDSISIGCKQDGSAEHTLCCSYESKITSVSPLLATAYAASTTHRAYARHPWYRSSNRGAEKTIPDVIHLVPRKPARKMPARPGIKTSGFRQRQDSAMKRSLSDSRPRETSPVKCSGSGLQIQRLLSLSVSGRLTISACDRRSGKGTDLQMVWQPIGKCPSSIRGKGIFYTAQKYGE